MPPGTSSLDTGQSCYLLHLLLSTDSPSCSFEHDTCRWSADAAWAVKKNLESAAGGVLESTFFHRTQRSLLSYMELYTRLPLCYSTRVDLCIATRSKSHEPGAATEKAALCIFV